MLQQRFADCQKQRRHQQRRLRLDRHSSNSRQVNLLPGLLIVLLVLLQNFELHMCRQLMHKRGRDNDDDVPARSIEQDGRHLLTPAELDKRSSSLEQSTALSSPEEIFSAPNDAADMSYDEYPMIVPKRAALLLDRLMVALHHALENEREGHRIGEFYANKNFFQQKPNEYKNDLDELQPTTGEAGSNLGANNQNFHMYSDDDPGVMLDYDFKDLNQINRATGETLMAKSFQRRAGLTASSASTASAASAAGMDTSTMMSGTAIGSSSARTTTTSTSGAGAGPGARRIHHITNGGGRVYWRCYFNAVSCF